MIKVADQRAQIGAPNTPPRAYETYDPITNLNEQVTKLGRMRWKDEDEAAEDERLKVFGIELRELFRGTYILQMK